MSDPSIQAPVALSRLGQPPIFHVNPGSPEHFYGLEIASDPLLLEPSESEVLGKSWKSWQHFPLFSSPSFELPEQVWRELSQANRLYYRALVSSNQRNWANYQVTTQDGELENAPVIQIITLFLSGLLDESPGRVEQLWKAAQQHSAIQHALAVGECSVSVHWHSFSPQRPLDPDAIELIVVATSKTHHEDAPVHVGIIRMDYRTLMPKDGQIFRDPQNYINQEQAWNLLKTEDFESSQNSLERQGELWVLSLPRPSPNHTGGTAIAHAGTGHKIYVATTSWNGIFGIASFG